MNWLQRGKMRNRDSGESVQASDEVTSDGNQLIQEQRGARAGRGKRDKNNHRRNALMIRAPGNSLLTHTDAHTQGPG